MTASVSPAVAAAATATATATHSQQSSQSSEKTSHSAVGVNDSPSASCRRCVKVLRDLIDGLQDPSSAATTATANKTFSSSSSSSSSSSTSKHRATTSITATTTTDEEPAPLTLLKAIASLGHLNKEQLRVEVVDDGVKLHLPVERTLPESLSPWSKWVSGGVVGGLATTTGSRTPAKTDDNNDAAAGGGIGGISGLLGSLPLALSVQRHQQQQQQQELIIAQQGDASQSQFQSQSPPPPPPPLIDPLTIELKCRKCASTGPEAGARAFLMGPTPLSVVVCHNRIQGHAQEVEEILTHELVHLYDVQTLQLDLQDCHNLAYSEIRAAKAAECRESWHPHLQKYCVKQKAICATNNLFPQQGRQCIQKVFDQAFADNRPFGRSSSVSAGGSTAAAAPPSSS